MELSEDVYEELIDTFDAEPEAPVPTKVPTTSPPCNNSLPRRSVPPKKDIPVHYPTFEDFPESINPVPSTTTSEALKMKKDVPVQVYDREELMSEEELLRKRQQIEREMRMYQERFDHVAQVLAGETPHQIQGRKKREEERVQRQERRYEAMETRLQHHVERLEEREERRARIQARHHRTSRSPSPSGSCGQAQSCEDFHSFTRE